LIGTVSGKKKLVAVTYNAKETRITGKLEKTKVESWFTALSCSF